MDCFHVLATVMTSVITKSRVNVSFQIMVFSEYMPRSGIAGSYVCSVFSSLETILSPSNCS